MQTRQRVPVGTLCRELGLHSVSPYSPAKSQQINRHSAEICHPDQKQDLCCSTIQPHNHVYPY